MAEVKLCKDCYWYKPDPNGDRRYAVCESPHSGTSLIDGEPMSRGLFCEVERRSGGFDLCGPEGRHWKPRAIKFDAPAGINALTT
jgi:hypothetical protein